jgi:hypothetical protein
MEELTEILAEVFERCISDGMHLPFVVCAVAPNGSLLAMRMHGDGMKRDMLAEHFEDSVFKLPMTVMVIDRGNEAVRVEEGATKIYRLPYCSGIDVPAA